MDEGFSRPIQVLVLFALALLSYACVEHWVVRWWASRKP